MEEGRRKQVMIGVIVACLSLAAYFTFSGGGRPSEREEIAEGATVWLKCLNPRCNRGNTAYEVDKLAYREFQRENMAEDTTPGMVCEKCGKPSAFQAIKCSSCENLFFAGDAGPGEPANKCPKCGTVQQ